MNIYLLKASFNVDYDSYDGHVVIADSERRARELCPKGDESYEYQFGKEPWRVEVAVWTDPERSTCEKIGDTYALHEHVVLSSYNAG